MAPTKTGRRRDSQMATGPHAAGRNAGLGIGKVSQQALAILHEGAALVRERYAPRGAHQQLDTQVRLQRVQPTPHDGGRHALGVGRRGEAAAGGHRDEGLNGFEFVHRG